MHIQLTDLSQESQEYTIGKWCLQQKVLEKLDIHMKEKKKERSWTIFLHHTQK